MKTETAFKRLEQFIRREREMRHYVFQSKPMKRDKKVAECDEALAALEALQGLVPTADQMELL